MNRVLIILKWRKISFEYPFDKCRSWSGRRLGFNKRYFQNLPLIPVDVTEAKESETCTQNEIYSLRIFLSLGYPCLCWRILIVSVFIASAWCCWYVSTELLVKPELFLFTVTRFCRLMLGAHDGIRSRLKICFYPNSPCNSAVLLPSFLLGSIYCF